MQEHILFLYSPLLLQSARTALDSYFLLSNTLKKLAFILRQSKTCSSDPAVPSPLGKKRQINASLSCRIGLFLLNHIIFLSHRTELKYVFVSTVFGHIRHHTYLDNYVLVYTAKTICTRRKDKCLMFLMCKNQKKMQDTVIFM